MTNDKEASLEGLRVHLHKCIDEHSKRKTDAILYNGGTVAVLLATSTATLLPDNLGRFFWIPKVLTGFAAFWVALERALSFGARWRFHVEMLNGYRTIEDMIDFYKLLPADERPKYLQDIFRELYTLRRREAGIPGSGVGASQTNT
jgi:hypothetical protein